MAKTKTPRNSIKGYTYQQSIFILFLGIMDTQKNIGKIVVEATDTKHFDDLYLKNVKEVDGTEKSFRLQVKNYPKATIDNISITEHFATIQGNKNEYDPADNNTPLYNFLNKKYRTGTF